MARLTPIKAIRKKCLDCCAGQMQEVRLCTAKTRALHPYRMGHRPKGEEIINDKDKTEKTLDSSLVISKEQQ